MQGGCSLHHARLSSPCAATGALLGMCEAQSCWNSHRDKPCCAGTRQPLQAATTPSADVVFIMEAAQVRTVPRLRSTFPNKPVPDCQGDHSSGSGSYPPFYEGQPLVNLWPSGMHRHLTAWEISLSGHL